MAQFPRAHLFIQAYVKVSSPSFFGSEVSDRTNQPTKQQKLTIYRKLNYFT